MDYPQVRALAAAYGSPFYWVSGRQFEANFEQLLGAFCQRYAKTILAYSYKTNYLPYLCQLVERKGGWAEVVSGMEYELARKVGVPAERIIFNGPVKPAAILRRALADGALVNVDSHAELPTVLDFADQCSQRQVKIGLRVNIALSDAAGRSHIQNRLKVGRFGFDPVELGEVKDTLSRQKNIQIVSLHGHTSTTDRSVECFQTIAQTLLEVAQKHFAHSIEYLNIGGGFFGYVPPAFRWCPMPTFDEYAQAVWEVLLGSAWFKQRQPTLVIEPGVALAANAVSFFTEVAAIKKIKEKTFVIVDGSAFHTKPTFHSVNLPFEVFSAANRADKVPQIFDIVGSTCMEKDILISAVCAPLPNVGDFLRIDNVGAYTIVMSPAFIHPLPAIVAEEGGKVFCVRRRQTMEDVFAQCVFDTPGI